MRKKLSRLGKAVVFGCIVGCVVTSASAAVNGFRGIFPIVVAAPVDLISSLTRTDDPSSQRSTPPKMRPLKFKVGPVPEYVEVSPVPEPSTGVVLCGGALLAGLRRPRKLRKS